MAPSCERSYAGRMNQACGFPCFSPSFREPPSPSSMNFCREILETLGYHTVKPEAPISPGLRMVPGRDTGTDRWTDRITIANTCYS